MIRMPKIFGMTLLLICITAIVTLCNTLPEQAQAGGKAEQTTASSVKPENNQQNSNKEAKRGSQQDSSKAVDKPQTHAVEIPAANPDFIVSEILGRPTDGSITVNVVPAKKMELYIEYRTGTANYTSRTDTLTLEASMPAEVLIEKLQPDTRYYYRIRYKNTGASSYASGSENTFMTQRVPGSTFTFDIQGDSHPERRQQFDPELYLKTMGNVRSDNPDFYMTIGDDFSVDTMKTISRDAVTKLYINQRNFLGLVGNSAPLFLVNGNHEQAAQYVLDGTPNNAAVWGQNARNSYFPQPAPDNFYTGNSKPVEFIGQLRDYYAWEWGDALFVIIDPYWHSSVPVDNVLGGGEKRTDLWETTLGEEQYQWLKKTLEESDAKYKFVFTHHVLGTGRGGTDIAEQYEWGGYNKNGTWEFDKKRPGWELPIHQLMAKNNVTIFFQGHDHIFVTQELDGVIYQTLPEPADPNYALYNSGAYKSDVKYPNSGHVRVTVSPEQVKVDYVRSVLPEDEKEGYKNGDVVYSYTASSEKPKDKKNSSEDLRPADQSVLDSSGGIILGCPTDKSVIIKAIAEEDMDIYFEYGKTAEGMSEKSKMMSFKKGEAIETELNNLSPDTQYYYKMLSRKAGTSEYVPTQTGTFHTQRRSGEAFVFTIQTDSHRDQNSEISLYERALQNVLADKPDFHIDLGDTFMSEKLAKTKEETLQRYIEDRGFFAKITASVPLFLVNGNHDGEWSIQKDADNASAWATNYRKLYFPNPISNGFYTGNIKGVGNYYSFNWGDALFIILDPFSFTEKKAQGSDDGWNMTLGKTQYDWLKNTLENSSAKYKFVFTHNLVGGYGNNFRGGAEAAKFLEWGGFNWDEKYDFDNKRTGWGKPIHDLLVENRVTAVFHGHDHFYAKQELDGITYQLVPQPSHPGKDVRNAVEYSYKEGVFLPPAGHLRVTVSKEETKVEYIIASLEVSENGSIAHSYILK